MYQINISFSVIFCEYYNISQTIQLEEKILLNNKCLTLKLTQMENEIIKLKKQIEELQNEEIIYAISDTYHGKIFKIKTNIQEIDFTKVYTELITINYFCQLSEFYKFKNLKKIIVNNHNVSNSFEYIICIPSFLNCNTIFLTSVLELDIKYIKNLSSNILQSSTLKSIPNLEKLTYYNYGYAKLESYELIKNMSKLKHVIYLTCLHIDKLEQIKKWCILKNIKLEIKS